MTTTMTMMTGRAAGADLMMTTMMTVRHRDGAVRRMMMMID
jgi:hypothetical protein